MSLAGQSSLVTQALQGGGRLLRLAAVGVFAGAVAGAIAGGGGSRVGMRILAAVNGERAGVITENGNISGQVTLDGTIGLILFGGVFAGIFGGLLYVIARRWLPGQRLWKGLAYGLLLFAMLGSVVLDKDNRDFALFGPKTLSVALFALLFPIYGLVVSPIAERLDRYVPPFLMHPAVTIVGYLVLAGLAAFGLFHTILALNAVL